ncbi:MAG: hypothetical protein UT55_C0001G0015 [Candidatus Peregrinibacteria bacterium GW2011_GWE2_39_6]|nr:MAG: hypothetical protein UT36_C0005G0039 [Candidatus Peregrinibacteria bacterium GW2011_GWF2_39_17]KKR26804.1 MAG: hypothetical protein UT55_C0001G0015 [Candidatus Peregrinibacteria bacterium GW2011_GWE2_39_6]HCW32875.1 hypothetical protein [Candidatus Peregrinibacteria bacterium]
MKIFYFIGAFVTFVVILVLSFENIQATCNYLNFFFWELPSNVSPTIILFGTSLLGMVVGSFLTLSVMSLVGQDDEDDEDENFNA